MEDISFNFSTSITPSPAPTEDDGEVSTSRPVCPAPSVSCTQRDNSSFDIINKAGWNEKLGSYSLPGVNDKNEFPFSPRNVAEGCEIQNVVVNEKGKAVGKNRDATTLFEMQNTETNPTGTNEKYFLRLPNHTEAALGIKEMMLYTAWLRAHPWCCELLVEHNWMDNRYLRISSINEGVTSSVSNEYDACQKVEQAAPLNPLPTSDRLQRPIWDSWREDNNFVAEGSAHPMLACVSTSHYSIQNRERSQSVSLEDTSSKDYSKLDHEFVPPTAAFADHIECFSNPNLLCYRRLSNSSHREKHAKTSAFSQATDFRTLSPTQSTCKQQESHSPFLENLSPQHVKRSSSPLAESSVSISSFSLFRNSQLDTIVAPQMGTNASAGPLISANARLSPISLQKESRNRRKYKSIDHFYLKNFLPTVSTFPSILGSLHPVSNLSGSASPYSPDPDYFEWQARFGQVSWSWDRKLSPLGYIPPLCNCENEEYRQLYKRKEIEQFEPWNRTASKSFDSSALDHPSSSPLCSAPSRSNYLHTANTPSAESSSHASLISEKKYSHVSPSLGSKKTLTKLPSVCFNKNCQGLLFVPYSFIEVSLNHEIDSVILFSKTVFVPADTELYCGNTRHTIIIVTRSPEHEYLCWKALSLRNLSDSSLIYDIDQNSFHPYFKPTLTSVESTLSSSTSSKLIASMLPSIKSFPNGMGSSNVSHPLTVSTVLDDSQDNPSATTCSQNGIPIKMFSHHRRPLILRLRGIKEHSSESAVVSTYSGHHGRIHTNASFVSLNATIRQLIKAIPDLPYDSSESLVENMPPAELKTYILSELRLENGSFSNVNLKLLKLLDVLIEATKNDSFSIYSTSDSEESITEKELEELAMLKPLEKYAAMHYSNHTEDRLCEDSGKQKSAPLCCEASQSVTQSISDANVPTLNEQTTKVSLGNCESIPKPREKTACFQTVADQSQHIIRAPCDGPSTSISLPKQPTSSDTSQFSTAPLKSILKKSNQSIFPSEKSKASASRSYGVIDKCITQGQQKPQPIFDVHSSSSTSRKESSGTRSIGAVEPLPIKRQHTIPHIPEFLQRHN
ncbi:hypothetical protein IE077_002827 [Cardiosporidium cionae]|uniref:Uncharacterized protein n=1 Tax=Cardiosporidium cionae TaxID=476202 RepID=A0ABQ7J9Y1_9APIC|nr:hypothetical protein IE077_002827 [Cardiosporidium cionae]|eukprot:KAF8820774.1 hypothetical protein IE077_002827 [Cardiosporidium cionae]